eukprot:scaffold1504_cov417-Prasinococcus_capsulatus_cf.AAC.57
MVVPPPVYARSSHMHQEFQACTGRRKICPAGTNAIDTQGQLAIRVSWHSTLQSLDGPITASLLTSASTVATM